MQHIVLEMLIIKQTYNISRQKGQVKAQAVQTDSGL